MREAVGHFVGADVLRALLALAEPNTCHNVDLLQHAVVRGVEQAHEIALIVTCVVVATCKRNLST